MTLQVIVVYHNADSRFFAYEEGHQLRQVISHWRQWLLDGTQNADVA